MPISIAAIAIGASVLPARGRRRRGSRRGHCTASRNRHHVCHALQPSSTQVRLQLIQSAPFLLPSLIRLPVMCPATGWSGAHCLLPTSCTTRSTMNSILKQIHISQRLIMQQLSEKRKLRTNFSCREILDCRKIRRR